MDGDRFDRLTRSLRGARSRRGVLAFLFGGGVSLLTPDQDAGEAKKKRRRRRKGNRSQSQAVCPPGEIGCPNDPFERCCPAATPLCCPFVPGGGTACCSTDNPKCCTATSGGYFCCPSETICCPGRPDTGAIAACCAAGQGSGGCCTGDHECNPTERCSANGCCIARCPSNQICDNSCQVGTATRSDARFRDLAGLSCNPVCPSGQECCDGICCPDTEECGPNLRCRIKCRSDERRCCGTDGSFSCCPTSQACCDAVCCPPGEECGPNLRCRIKCKAGERRCEGTDGSFSCCPSTQNCCGSVCCPPGEQCGANLRCTRG
jgi:hypothetical protein